MKHLLPVLFLLVFYPAFADQPPPDTHKRINTGVSETTSVKKEGEKKEKEPAKDFTPSWKFYLIVFAFPAILIFIAFMFVFKRKKE